MATIELSIEHVVNTGIFCQDNNTTQHVRGMKKIQLQQSNKFSGKYSISLWDCEQLLLSNKFSRNAVVRLCTTKEKLEKEKILPESKCEFSNGNIKKSCPSLKRMRENQQKKYIVLNVFINKININL